jgi:nitrile hydratase
MVAEPRRVLAEMGMELPAEARVRVWDSSAEARYMVLPERPPGTDGLSAEELVPLVTRDSMIGVGRPLSPNG